MVLAAAPAYEAPQPRFGIQTTTGRAWNGSHYVGSDGESAGEIFASQPPEVWAKMGIFHPSDRQRWIDAGVYKPPEKTQ